MTTGVIEELHALAGRVNGRNIQHINSTPAGGVVAGILTRLVPMMTLKNAVSP